MNLNEDNSGFIKELFLRHVKPGVAAQIISTIGPIVCGAIAGTVFGKTGLAVTGLYTPLFFLAGFFGTIIASGSATLASKYIARNDDRRVAGVYTLALLLSVLCAAALFGISILLRNPVLTVLTGNGGLLEAASLNYLPSVLYMCFTVVFYMPLFWARQIGRPFVDLVLTLTLTGASIIAGGLFVFVFEFGLESLALGQALATALALVVSMALLHLSKNRLHVCKPQHIREDTAELISLGSPPGLSRLYRFICLFLINIILLNYAGPEAVAVYSVLNMLLRFITAFISGVSGVQMPIAGVLWEERDITSLRQLAHIVFISGNIVITTAAVLMLVSHKYIAALFGAGGEMFLPALVCFCVYVPFYVNGSFFVSWYTSIRRVKLANLIAPAQDIIFPLLFVVLFAAAGGFRIFSF